MSNDDHSKKTDKWQKIAEDAQKNEPAPESEPAEGQLEFPSRQQLEDQLTAMERQLNEYKEQTTRALAELKNVQWRAEREISNAYKFSVKDLIKSLLPVIDSLIRGLESGDLADPKVQAMHSGMRLTLDLLHKALNKSGLEMIEPAVGSEFNPSLHEAMGMQPGGKTNTIAQVLQKGYQLHGQVLRPAMVMVYS